MYKVFSIENMLTKVRFLSGFGALKRCLHSEREIKIGILGVPFDKGQPMVGVANGPDAIRKEGLVEQLAGIRKLCRFFKRNLFFIVSNLQ